MKVVVSAAFFLADLSIFAHALCITKDPSLEASTDRYGGGSSTQPIRIEDDNAYVTVEEGILRGAVVTSELGTQFASFKGVPYAQPPVEDLRFREPQPASAWAGARDALQQPLACPQRRGRATSEDCLYMNVFAPLGGSALAPVLVWIPGGGFTGGTNEHEGPDFFIEEGVLLVAINYRLGSLGFLTTEDGVIPGNLGLKDQLMALQWVKRNIAAFNGDPDNITVGGESAGACSVGHLVVSPATTGLFQRATIVSGEAISPWGVIPEPRVRAFRLGEALGFKTDDSNELLNFLKTQNADDLISHDIDVIPEEERIRTVDLSWGPVIESDVEGAVITDWPINNMRADNFKKIPVLVGFTSGDGIVGAYPKGYLSNATALQELNDNFVAATAPLLRLSSAEEREEAALEMRAFYFGTRNITQQEIPTVVTMMTDFGFIEPSDTAVRIIANQSDAAPIYYHLFDYRGPSIGNSILGTPHGAQRSVLFSGQVQNPDEEFIQLRTNMVRLWANFVKSGTPSPEGEPIVWTAFDNAEQNYMYITSTFEMKQNVYKDRMDFWHEIVPV